jgi:hypothetical protein
LTQVVFMNAPRRSEYDPLRHKVHEMLLGWVEYEPRVQLAQVEELLAPVALENLPGRHWVHSGLDSPTKAEYPPGGQRVQFVLPAAEL